MTNDELLPPPPYSAEDPLRSNPPSAISPTNESQLHLRGGNTPSYDIVIQERQRQAAPIQFSNTVPTEEEEALSPSGLPTIQTPLTPVSPAILSPHFSSAAAYFEENQVAFAAGRDVIEHHMTIYPRSQSKDFNNVPRCWRSRFSEISKPDWDTFVNYLLPPHLNGSTPVDRKLQRERERDSKGGSLETDDERKARVDAVVAEWNEGFFGPRSIRVAFDYVTGLETARTSPLCPACYPSSTRSIPRKPVSRTSPNLTHAQTMPSMPFRPSTRHCPRSQTSLPAEPTQPSQPSEPHAPYGMGPLQWVQTLGEKAQRCGEQISQQAQAHGLQIELEASRRGSAVERRAQMYGEYVQRHARIIETLGTQISERFAHPNPWDGRGRHPYHHGHSFHGHHGHSFHGHHGHSFHGHHGHHGRPRSRSSSVSSVSSLSSSSSEESVDSISSRDLEGVEIEHVRRALSNFRVDPTKRDDIALAVRTLKANLLSYRSSNLVDRKAHKNEWKALRKDFRDIIKSAKKERRAVKTQTRGERRRERRTWRDIKRENHDNWRKERKEWKEQFKAERKDRKGGWKRERRIRDEERRSGCRWAGEPAAVDVGRTGRVGLVEERRLQGQVDGVVDAGVSTVEVPAQGLESRPGLVRSQTATV